MNDLKFAIDMEHDGEKYYRQQAEINKSNSFFTVCIMMAEEEKVHAQILTDMLNSEKLSKLPDANTLAKTKSIFEGIGDIKSEAKSIANQLDFYRFASNMEQESIDLYTKHLSDSVNQQERDLFTYLIYQEKQHFEILDELASLLRNAEEWVESPEFGVRKEY